MLWHCFKKEHRKEYEAQMRASCSLSVSSQVSHLFAARPARIFCWHSNYATHCPDWWALCSDSQSQSLLWANLVKRQPISQRTNQLKKSYISELAFDNSDYVAKLGVSEHLKVVGQLVSQACRTECTGRGNVDVSRKMTILEWYLPFAPAKIWPPTTSAISGTPRSLTYELLWESPHSLNLNLKSDRLVDVIPILNNVLPNTRTILR